MAEPFFCFKDKYKMLLIAILNYRSGDREITLPEQPKQKSFESL